MDTTNNETSLAAQLNAAKEKFRSTAPQELVQHFSRFVDELEQDNITERALAVGEKAPGFVLPNALGKSVTLGELIRTGPVILTWYRGGWCPYCNLQLNYLQQFLPAFEKEGARLVAITPETPDSSLSTQERHDLRFEVLTDPGNNIAGMYGGVHRLPADVKKFYAERNVFDHYDGEPDEFPVPATYIIDKEGIIRFRFVDPDYRKRAEPADLLAALQQINR
ncbi:MAG TPA: peroxiredoxin-like family protein [Puia sp.]